MLVVMARLTGTNEKTLFVVYNEEKYNDTGEVEIIEETEKLLKFNKSLNYSSYPPYCYVRNKN